MCATRPLPVFKCHRVSLSVFLIHCKEQTRNCATWSCIVIVCVVFHILAMFFSCICLLLNVFQFVQQQLTTCLSLLLLVLQYQLHKQNANTSKYEFQYKESFYSQHFTLTTKTNNSLCLSLRGACVDQLTVVLGHELDQTYMHITTQILKLQSI
jgi:hypothetical protein